MHEGRDLALGGEAAQRLLLQHAGVVGQVIEDAAVHHEEAAVNETGLLIRPFP